MNPTAQVHRLELDDWADLLGRVQDWLLHAGDGTVADYNEFKPWSQTFDDLVDEIGRCTARIRRVVDEALR